MIDPSNLWLDVGFPVVLGLVLGLIVVVMIRTQGGKKA